MKKNVYTHTHTHAIAHAMFCMEGVVVMDDHEAHIKRPELRGPFYILTIAGILVSTWCVSSSFSVFSVVENPVIFWEI